MCVKCSLELLAQYEHVTNASHVDYFYLNLASSAGEEGTFFKLWLFLERCWQIGGGVDSPLPAVMTDHPQHGS